MSREVISTALLSTLKGAYAWKTTGRRVVLWDKVPLSQRPALFLAETLPEQYSWTALPNARRTLGYRLFIYTDAKSPTVIGAQQINEILDALDAALMPPPGFQTQTLGQVCQNCRIKEVPHKNPGDLTGDGILVVDIEVFVP
jgi:hypothetical protein